jgi:hypothetical protein
MLEKVLHFRSEPSEIVCLFVLMLEMENTGAIELRIHVEILKFYIIEKQLNFFV